MGDNSEVWNHGKGAFKWFSLHLLPGTTDVMYHQSQQLASKHMEHVAAKER